jgi:hypothetical protein
MTKRLQQQKKRLAALKADKARHPTESVARRYKLPEKAIELFVKAGAVHGNQSRAIQVGVELLWHSIGYGVTDEDIKSITDSPLTGKTYMLPVRTVGLIDGLGKEYGTLGRVMAAVAYLLSKPDPRKALTRMPLPPHGKKDSLKPLTGDEIDKLL